MSMYPPAPQAAPPAVAGWQRPQLGSAQAHRGYEPRATNTVAFWSMIATASAWILTGPLGTIAGLILGFVSLRQIRERGEDGRDLALISIVFALASVVVGVIFLISIVSLIGSMATMMP